MTNRLRHHATVALSFNTFVNVTNHIHHTKLGLVPCVDFFQLNVAILYLFCVIRCGGDIDKLRMMGLKSWKNTGLNNGSNLNTSLQG